MEERNIKSFSIKPKFTTTYASDSTEFEAAIELLVESFYFVESSKLHESMRAFIYNTPGLHCLLVKKKNEIVGLQCILNRSMYFFGVNCTIAGMSYAAIKREYQNTEVGQLLKSTLFNYIEKNADLSLGFARKAMDNYWYPYGYRGVTNFCQTKLPLKNVAIVKFNIVSRPAEVNDINSISRMYNETYRNLIGPLIRNKENWIYNIAKYENQPSKIMIMLSDEIVIGYYLICDNVVQEIGFNKTYIRQVFHFILRLIKDIGYNEVIFKIGKFHPLIAQIMRYEHSFTTRYVWNGGHIAKIKSVIRYLNKISSVLLQRIENLNIKDFDFSCNAIRFIYSESNLTIIEYKGLNPNLIFENSEWVKAIFGVISVKYLVGFRGDENANLLEILFPECNPQFPELDQF